MSGPKPRDGDEPATYSTVYYMPALTGGHILVDDKPGASARFWQAMVESVRRQQARHERRRR